MIAFTKGFFVKATLFTHFVSDVAGDPWRSGVAPPARKKNLREVMAIAEDSALSGLHQFLAATQPLHSLQRSPDKMPSMDEIMSTVLQQIPAFNYPVYPGWFRPYRQEPWHECFTTVSNKEFEALIYSLYVMARDDKKLDGYEYYECINRLQSKCRYRVRARRMNEFIIVEERGAHNHAMEPVGTPGTHAGLPKTLREIVDRSFYEDWNNATRQEKLEEEVRRLGLPHNPRLGRQVDNRIAYLRRVKNLNEMKKIQDQVAPMHSLDLSMNAAEPKTNGMPEAIAQASQIAALDVPKTNDLLKMMMQAGQFPELNSDTQAQLMALMMGGAAPMPTDGDEVKEQVPPTATAPAPMVLPPFSTESAALLGNPFLQIPTSLPGFLPVSIANSFQNPPEEAAEMEGERDTDSGTEDDQLQIDMDQ
ncbi:unnamed protein product [Nippostrongylus brasiliensis]|uniref:FLYWCH-type domain-containing protein n=1 Tax=Nippostrongylus brasiliensis TaxID=27835 RepID=A0A0N4XTX1_NIPBR|nr:unnamed protein product [Nippostrongylus brasiliensis]